MKHIAPLISGSPPVGSETLLNILDWSWINWLNVLIPLAIYAAVFIGVETLLLRLYHRDRLCVSQEHGLRGGFTEHATNAFQVKLTELQWLLFQLYEHLEARGVAAGNDGAISLIFPARFWTADTAGRIGVEITSSSFGDERVSVFPSIDGALVEVHRWHQAEMKAD